MKIKVKITQFIIDASDGCRGKIDSCLIARAVREIFPTAVVFNDKIYLNGDSAQKMLDKAVDACMTESISYIKEVDKLSKLEKTIDLPKLAIDLIKAFDDDKEITPTSFEIDVPMSIIESIGISSVYKILSESKTLECVEI